MSAITVEFLASVDYKHQKLFEKKIRSKGIQSIIMYLWDQFVSGFLKQLLTSSQKSNWYYRVKWHLIWFKLDVEELYKRSSSYINFARHPCIHLYIQSIRFQRNCIWKPFNWIPSTEKSMACNSEYVFFSPPLQKLMLLQNNTGANTLRRLQPSTTR